MIVLIAGLVNGVAIDITVNDGRIVAIAPSGGELPTEAKRVDLKGRWVVPAAVDSHVHLALYPREAQLAASGIAAAVDWGAPLATLDRDHGPLHRVDAGPLLTAPGGYPTRSWGRDGYGLEVTDPAADVDRVLAAGAKLIKLAMAGEPSLSDAQVQAIVARAHARGVQVGAHALSEAEAARAARLGVDLLVHTPVEPLEAATAKAWKGRAVISTLTAFSEADAVRNLRLLRDAGAEVLYGTDLGNTREAAIQCGEVRALVRAGLDGKAVLAALTTGPAKRFGLPLGLEVGREASLLVLADDPAAVPETLCRPAQVWMRGKPLTP